MRSVEPFAPQQKPISQYLPRTAPTGLGQIHDLARRGDGIATRGSRGPRVNCHALLSGRGYGFPALEHDPEKPARGRDPGVKTGFPKRSRSIKMLERRSIHHEAIALQLLSPGLPLRNSGACL